MSNESADVYGANSDVYGANSVANALRTLLFLRGREYVRLTEVSDHLGVARSTAHRLLATLRTHGFVEQEPAGRRYRLGPALTTLARGIADERALIRIARPHLQALRDAARETANLLVLDGPDCFFLDGVEGPRTLRVAQRTGDHLPAYTTAGGKVLLAELTLDQVREHYPRGVTPLTPETVPDLDSLAADLAECRSRGYALNFSESVAEVHAIGVPVRDHHGVCVAAVTVAAPSTRLGHTEAAELFPLLERAASDITKEL